jgi:hypothetical protein
MLLKQLQHSILTDPIHQLQLVTTFSRSNTSITKVDPPQVLTRSQASIPPPPKRKSLTTGGAYKPSLPQQ